MAMKFVLRVGILVLGKCYCLCFVADQPQVAALPSRCDVKSIQFTVSVVYFLWVKMS